MPGHENYSDVLGVILVSPGIRYSIGILAAQHTRLGVDVFD
jgi:hypothetical protein